MSKVLFTIRALWSAGGLAPADIGRRILLTLQQFEPLSPAMRNWLLLDRPGERYVTLRDATPNIAAFVRLNVWESDFGGSDPNRGFGLYVKGSETPSEHGAPDSINITLDVGGKWTNRIEFEVGDQRSPPDPTSVTYQIYRGALETIAAAWPCPWAFASSHTLPDLPSLEPWDGDLDKLIARVQTRKRDFRGPYAAAWIAYLSPQFAKGSVAPPELVREQTPGGGVILSAVTERFDESNPAHTRRSRVLEAVLNERLGFGPRYGPNSPDRPAEPPARPGPY